MSFAYSTNALKSRVSFCRYQCTIACALQESGSIVRKENMASSAAQALLLLHPKAAAAYSAHESLPHPPQFAPHSCVGHHAVQNEKHTIHYNHYSAPIDSCPSSPMLWCCCCCWYCMCWRGIREDEHVQEAYRICGNSANRRSKLFLQMQSSCWHSLR